MLHIFRPSTGHCHQALAIPSHPNSLLAIHRQSVASQCHHKPSKSFTDHWHPTMHDTIHPSQSPAIPRPSSILHRPTVTSYCHQIWSSFELYFSLLRGTGQVGLWYGYASTSPGVGSTRFSHNLINGKTLSAQFCLANTFWTSSFFGLPSFFALTITSS